MTGGLLVWIALSVLLFAMVDDAPFAGALSAILFIVFLVAGTT